MVFYKIIKCSFVKKRCELNRINKKIQMLQKKYNNWETQYRLDYTLY